MEQFDKGMTLLLFAVYILFLSVMGRYERRRRARLLAVVVGQEQAATEHGAAPE
jgi:hypothetical protein